MRDDKLDAYTYTMVVDEFENYERPNYYARRLYGKWTIYNKDGWRVAHGMNEKQMKAYMKLLEEKG